MWYIVVVFFASGSITGPAHFEENWYPKPVGEALTTCRIIGKSVLEFLNSRSAPNLRGEAYQVSCIGASNAEELSDLIKAQWTFEPAPVPAPPPVPDAPA